MRLDVYLVENGFCRSRERAKYHIMAGNVLVNGKKVIKPSYAVSDADIVGLNQSSSDFFSKGAQKLQKAINDFNLDFNDKLVLDVGASTGGFTFCALQHGAKFVWAVDVGSNQLDEFLINHSKVCSLEKTDIRTLDLKTIGTQVDVVTADLSFISLTQVAESLVRFLKPDGFMVLLIKPQFEAGKEHVGKNGIVKDKKVHEVVVGNVARCFASLNLYLNNITFAPLKGKGYNIEYLGLFSKSQTITTNINFVVNKAFDLNRTLK
ncbi:TlyA family RNA methyltransferase [Tenuifilum thalassicum]|uniref:TlyA family RNA methyltransferase n=1 Tax=Tenuifilum thalassicum TaxID=2590900 RepID=A0A7D4BSI3_9BACT|nr:TlyA family RNA methyltransferase [Tenuifilum thalassicum]QKG80441.1 TlyA family RNA methyltransferase [Tenuifilum thalassicum]